MLVERHISVTAISGLRYRLAIDGIVDWWVAWVSGLTFVQMSLGEQPILVCATVKEMDACYAQIAQCPIREA